MTGSLSRVLLAVAAVATAIVGPVSSAAVTPAAAATVRNGDAQTYKLQVIVESKPPRAIEIGPRTEAKDVCPDGCILRITDDGNNDYILDGSEQVSIENGVVYYDGEVVKAPPVPKAPQ